MTFGARIRQLRKQHGLTLRDLAGQIGIDFTYLSKIENDQGSPPSEATIRRFAKVFAVDPEELILLADKLPESLQQDLLDRPEQQVAGLYRTMAGKRYSDAEWKEVLRILAEKGEA